MADKKFGVKQIDLIGASGTPTLTSPNNLNINAINVAISTDISVGGDISVNGNLSIGGTFNALSVSGVSTLTRVNVGTVSSIFDLVDQGDDVPLLKIGNDLVLANIADPFFDPYRNWIYSDEYDLCVGTRGETGSNYNHIILVGIHTGNDQYDPNTSYVTLRYGNSQTKLTTTGYGVTISGDLNVSGVVTETAYYGDASRVVSGKWTLGANGTSNYTFDGVGVNAGNNYNTPMYLARGCVYEFVNNSGGSHPFQIRVSNGGAAYSTGVTNNGASSGTIRFEVPMDAPNSLYYQCTSHSGMGGTITVYPDAVV